MFLRFLSFFKYLVNGFLEKFNLRLIFYSSFRKLLESKKDLLFLKFIKEIDNKNNLSKLIQYYSFSKSEFIQDLFVLNKLNFKRRGFFVEIGASDGENYSNTYLLEKKFGWNGILCEPNKNYIKQLKKKRNAYVVTKAVWKNSFSQVLFEVSNQKGLSTISSFRNKDFHYRKIIDKYLVETISLNDLLLKNNAPKVMDYLSIDTEGSEYEILKNFNFNKFKFKVITCEHNQVKTKRKLINKLLILNGYKKCLNKFTKNTCEDWYYNRFLIK